MSSASSLHDKVTELQVALNASNYADPNLAPILKDIADCLALASQAINELWTKTLPVPRFPPEVEDEMRSLIAAARSAVADLQAAAPPAHQEEIETN